MIKIRIVEAEQELSQVNEGWIYEQIRRRQNDGHKACERVSIKTRDLDIILSSGDCPSGSGKGRAPTDAETQLFETWDNFRLEDSPINSGRLVAFLQRIKNLS